MSRRGREGREGKDKGVNKLALFDLSQLLFKMCVLLFDEARFDFVPFVFNFESIYLET